MKSRFLKIAVIVATLTCSGAAMAGQVTSNMTASITVSSFCSVSSNGNISFGTIDKSLAGPFNASSYFIVTCNSGTPYTVDIGDSDSGHATLGAANGSQGSLGSGSDHIFYTAYSDSFGGTPWVTQSVTALQDTGVAHNVNVYLQILANSPAGNTNVPSGAYSSTITATVNY